MGKEDRLTKREIEIVREAVNAYRKELVDEERELRYECIKDLMGNIDQQLTRSERRIQRNEEKRRKDLFEIQCLEKAVELYKKRM